MKHHAEEGRRMGNHTAKKERNAPTAHWKEGGKNTPPNKVGRRSFCFLLKCKNNSKFVAGHAASAWS